MRQALFLLPIISVFVIELFEDVLSFYYAQELFVLDDGDGFQVFCDHDAGQVFYGGIRAGHDDFFGHELFGCAGEEFLEALLVFLEVAVIDVGAQEVDVLRDAGLDFLIQEVGVGDDADDFLVVLDDRDGVDVVFYEHIDEIKNGRIFLRRNDIFFHNICCRFRHKINPFITNSMGACLLFIYIIPYFGNIGTAVACELRTSDFGNHPLTPSH